LRREAVWVVAITALDLAMLSSNNTEGGSQAVHDEVPENGSAGAAGQTGMGDLSLEAGDEEPVELITALGVFDPNLVFASALDMGFRDQWVCSYSCSMRTWIRSNAFLVG
jgi:hypothetical protein